MNMLRGLSGSDKPLMGQTWYLPHHAVYNINKPDKIRVVFDASAKFLHISLNDDLLQRPDLTNKLTGVLLRLRLGKIAVKANIEKCFCK